ncbi:hypothetical protein D9756_005150 [Leucocoprinus leucothites]|uniref:Uncharacterized protein n=1 Tax=Leucocoprinus leucothites TaxID=201217 RepID=A0A8H5G927_9AGAR|nr:hypothetical protein D9756_005150 [Leucoagaricus leucothites]
MHIVENMLGNEERHEEEDDEDMMSVDKDDEADDKQEDGVLMSARTRGRQRRDPKADEAWRIPRLEARCAA